MAVRPPADAVVALRSLGRRYRALFAGLPDDEAPDDVAHRVGSDGRSALDHVVAATRTITLLGRALEQVVVEDDPVLHAAVGDPAERAWDQGLPGGTVEERLAELAWEADELAERASRIRGAAWARQARLAGRDDVVTAAALVWDAVDSALGHLQAAERTLAEVRAQR